MVSGRMKSIHRQTHASGVSAVFRKHLAGVFAGEDYIDALSGEQVKVVSKGAPPERVNVPEAIRVDIDLISAMISCRGGFSPGGAGLPRGCGLAVLRQDPCSIGFSPIKMRCCLYGQPESCRLDNITRYPPIPLVGRSGVKLPTMSP